MFVIPRDCASQAPGTCFLSVARKARLSSLGRYPSPLSSLGRYLARLSSLASPSPDICHPSRLHFAGAGDLLSVGSAKKCDCHPSVATLHPCHPLGRHLARLSSLASPSPNICHPSRLHFAGAGDLLFSRRHSERARRGDLVMTTHKDGTWGAGESVIWRKRVSGSGRERTRKRQRWAIG